MRILIVEDDQGAATLEQMALEREGFEVAVCGTVRTAVRLARVWDPHLILLDRMLPDGDGKDVIAEVREFSPVPIILVTGRAEDVERVAGLDAGADDYVIKPFNVPELVARVRAVLRRVAEPIEKRDILRYKDLELDEQSRQLRRGGETMPLTRIEFDLLRLLMREPGTVVTRNDMARAIWNLPLARVGKALDVHMSMVRRKLGDDPRAPIYIETVRGIGFRLAD